MSEYFRLQRKLIDRKLIEFGIKPSLAFILATLSFLGITILLFYKTHYAPWLYLALFNMLCLPLSEKQRNEFLKNIYPRKHYQKLRLIENLLIALPFVIGLISYHAYEFAGLLALNAILIGYYRDQNWTSVSIPTPFYNYPFEFPSGFRKYISIFLFAIFLSVMAISVNNFNLFGFSILMVILTCISFYQEIENTYFIWLYDKSASRFIANKLKEGFICLSIIYLPIFLVGLIFFEEHMYIMAMILGIGFLYLATMIVGKYARYPKTYQLKDVIMISVSFIFIPLLIILIPYYYKRSIEQLKSMLR